MYVIYVCIYSIWANTTVGQLWSSAVFRSHCLMWTTCGHKMSAVSSANWKERLWKCPRLVHHPRQSIPIRHVKQWGAPTLQTVLPSTLDSVNFSADRIIAFFAKLCVQNVLNSQCALSVNCDVTASRRLQFVRMDQREGCQLVSVCSSVSTDPSQGSYGGLWSHLIVVAVLCDHTVRFCFLTCEVTAAAIVSITVTQLHSRQRYSLHTASQLCLNARVNK